MGVFQRLSLVLVLCCGRLLAEICPPDWRRYDESCYFIIKDKMDWFQANRTCAQREANLAIPNSRFKQDFIWELFLKVLDQKPSTSLWIACNDIEEEGKWQHCPLRGETNAYENWADGQPDSYLNNTDCGVMWVDGNGSWDNQHCIQNTRYAVCEILVYNCRLIPQCLLHHAMEEVLGTSCGKDRQSHPRCHSFTLDNCGHQ